MNYDMTPEQMRKIGYFSPESYTQGTTGFFVAPFRITYFFVKKLGRYEIGKGYFHGGYYAESARERIVRDRIFKV